MMKVNIDILHQDLKFPLDWGDLDYKTFIFDAKMNMVAQVNHDVLDSTRQYHPFEKLIGDFKDIKVFESNPRYLLHNGDFYDKFIKESNLIGFVRGWGTLQKKPNGEFRQDNIAAYILNVINNS